MFAGLVDHFCRAFRGYPNIVVFELTTKCQLNCSYCARSSLLSQRRFFPSDMPLELLEQICQNLAVVKRNIKGIEFAGLGEPLLHGKIDQALLLIRSRFPNVPFRLFSNGLVLKAKTDLILKTLTKSDDKLVVSLNSADAESYARLNNADYFNLICENIKAFLKKKDSRPPQTFIQLMGTDRNIRILDRFRRDWQPLLNQNDHILVAVPENSGGLISFGSSYSNSSAWPCAQLWDHLVFTSGGDVYPCCVARLAGKSVDTLLGSASDLPGILRGRKLSYLRNCHRLGLANRLKPCASCDMWRKFGRHHRKFLDRFWL